MKISVITVCKNPGNNLKSCIESVLSQMHINVEYIILDGASSDGTKEIIKNYENKISQFISEPDKGIYDAINKGIDIATGDIVGFLNSDDIYSTIY